MTGSVHVSLCTACTGHNPIPDRVHTSAYVRLYTFLEHTGSACLCENQRLVLGEQRM